MSDVPTLTHYDHLMIRPEGDTAADPAAGSGSGADDSPRIGVPLGLGPFTGRKLVGAFHPLQNSCPPPRLR
jgi:hypothetical protein